MYGKYDIFEKLPNGSRIWRGHVTDSEKACNQLEEIAKQTQNECFAVNSLTKEVVLRLNNPKAKSAAGGG